MADTLKTVQALVRIDELLTNLQPHIEQACRPGHAQFIDNYVDPALEEVRALIAQMQREAVQPDPLGMTQIPVRTLGRLHDRIAKLEKQRVDDFIAGSAWRMANADESLDAMQEAAEWWASRPADAAPHPEAQALDSQLQQPEGHSTRASGVCASTTHAAFRVPADLLVRMRDRLFVLAMEDADIADQADAAALAEEADNIINGGAR